MRQVTGMIRESKWCGRKDLNLHLLRDTPLKRNKGSLYSPQLNDNRDLDADGYIGLPRFLCTFEHHVHYLCTISSALNSTEQVRTQLIKPSSKEVWQRKLTPGTGAPKERSKHRKTRKYQPKSRDTHYAVRALSIYLQSSKEASTDREPRRRGVSIDGDLFAESLIGAEVRSTKPNQRIMHLGGIY
jgi:hypothetical protein